MLYTITKATVKRVRGSQYVVLLLKLDPNDKHELPKRIVIFDKNMMNAILSGNTRQLEISETKWNGVHTVS